MRADGIIKKKMGITSRIREIVGERNEPKTKQMDDEISTKVMETVLVTRDWEGE